MTEDEMEFEIRQVEMRERSKYTGLAAELRKRLGLEIEGIEDILPYLPKDVIPSIQERLDRMKTILEEVKR